MEREKLFRETFEQAAVGIVHTSLRGTILRVNQRTCAMLGYTPAQLRGLNFLDITHAEDLPSNVREFKRALAGEFDSYRVEQRLLCKDQRHVWVSMSVALKRGATRLPDYSIVVIDDISARKHAEADALEARVTLQEQLTRLEQRSQQSEAALQAQSEAAAQARGQAGAGVRRGNCARRRRRCRARMPSSPWKVATDSLTGLANRRSFSRRIEQAASALRSSRKPYGPDSVGPG